jgi:hypothetical protein
VCSHWPKTAIAHERISKVVLVSAHVMPYDDPEIVAGLSAAEQGDDRLLRGRSPELEAEYAASAASMAEGSGGDVASVGRRLGTPRTLAG